MRYMIKFMLRIAMYFIVFTLLSQFFVGMGGSIPALLLLALILAIANGSVRPVLTLVTLPLNLITFGVASVFVNMLTLLISDAIVGAVGIHGFWLMALASVLVIAADSLIRWMRHSASLNTA